MSSKRTLPERHNPMVEPRESPPYEILVERRRLGRTNLAVKAGQLGIANASKEENLGVIDYAHLRVPLPKDLKGSGIFSMQRNHGYPEAYFLMRRSSDGYVSATGMFKVAFPWASKKEEDTEREHGHRQPTTADDEVAGNIWVPPTAALDLASEYGIRPWIEALLDPEPIESAKADNVQISTPPPFQLPATRGAVPTPKATPGAKPQPSQPRGTASSRRSTSPTKKASMAAGTPAGRKMASPRKRAAASPAKSGAKAGATKAGSKGASAAAKALQDVISHDAGSATPAAAKRRSGGGEANRGDAVKVAVTSSVDGEATHTKVEMPAGHADLALPEDAEAMIATAKDMVQEAAAMEGHQASAKSKRKVADAVANGEEDAVEAEGSARGRKGKGARDAEQRLKVERVKGRALIGLAATLALGATIPYFLG